jgi:hypothetical protein
MHATLKLVQGVFIADIHSFFDKYVSLSSSMSCNYKKEQEARITFFHQYMKSG